MSQRTPLEVEKRVVALREEWYGYWTIKNIIEKELGYYLPRSTVVKIVERKDAILASIDNLNNRIEEVSKYDYDDENYIFYKANIDWPSQKYTIPIQLVDDMFTRYSRYGSNWTGQQCIDYFKLKPVVWNMLRSRLDLSKNSDVLSPIGLARLEKIDEELVDKKIEEATYENIQNKYKGKYIKTYTDVIRNDYKKLMKISANRDNYLEHLRSYLDSYKPQVIPFVKHKIKNQKSVTYIFSDIHLWMKGTADIQTRLQNITADMCAEDARDIFILNLGDLAETFVEWGMHPWQVEDMEGIYWFDLMMFVVNNLEAMILQLYKQGKNVHFVGIWGNHGRLQKDHNQDMRRTWDIIVYELLKRWLQNIDVTIEYYQNKVNTITKDIHRIFAHGDEWFDKRKPEDILWKHWKQGVDNIIIHWDKHHISATETKDATMIGTPALASRWEYAQRIDVWSEPWYVRVQRNHYDKLDVLIRRMP